VSMDRHPSDLARRIAHRLRARHGEFETRWLRNRAMDPTLGQRLGATIDQRTARFVTAMVAGRQAAGIRAGNRKRRQGAASANLSARDGGGRGATAYRYTKG